MGCARPALIHQDVGVGLERVMRRIHKKVRNLAGKEDEQRENKENYVFWRQKSYIQSHNLHKCIGKPRERRREYRGKI